MELEIFGITMSAWQIFVSIGVLLIIGEIFTTTFVFLPIGIACITTAIFTPFITSTTNQLFLFSIQLVVIYFVFQKLLKPKFKKDHLATNVSSMVGKTAIVTEAILADRSKGKIKLYSDNWVAVSEDNKNISEGSTVVINRVEGNKVFVTKHKEQ